MTRERNWEGCEKKQTYAKEPTLGWSAKNNEQREGGGEVKKNGVFLFEMYFYILWIFMFLYYRNGN